MWTVWWYVHAESFQSSPRGTWQVGRQHHGSRGDLLKCNPQRRSCPLGIRGGGLPRLTIVEVDVCLLRQLHGPRDPGTEFHGVQRRGGLVECNRAPVERCSVDVVERSRLGHDAIEVPARHGDDSVDEVAPCRNELVIDTPNDLVIREVRVARLGKTLRQGISDAV